MDETKLRAQLVYSLGGKGAHMPFDKAVKGFPADAVAKRVPHLAHTAWQQVYHLWITQWDILEFSRDPAHESPAWPDGYWPTASADAGAWEQTVAKFRSDLAAMIDLVKDQKNDLLAPFPHGQGQTLLREALLVIDHNSYHVAQLVDLRRLLGIDA
ncbi:MAG TPA: DinB family protein [Spirochaetia bacterium]|nr:DinB family protein [Spirochaetia bacterium]